MLPALTFTPRRIRPRRLLAGAIGFLLLAISAVTASLSSIPPATDAAAASKTLAQRLAGSTWALAVPTAWLAAPLPEVRVGDSVDLMAVRTGDRPFALAIAADLRVMSVDERSVVFEVDEERAIAIATGRASGLLLVPLLRSAR
ncbi:MAG TPA: hypothetical protein VGR87_08885 [Candidatus Limnocylindria bacterium]|jgi:hypothetical protein|nr:hypothetical protein [Candidatus Limnocylindria bacterium]